MNPSERVWRERGLRSAVLAGDERAWQTLYEESFASLTAYAAWRCAGLRDLRDEIIQETWLTAVRKIRAFHPEQGSFAGWLRGIAANLLRNHFRSRNRRGEQANLRNGHCARDTGAEQVFAQGELAQRIACALTELSEREEAVLRAKYLELQSVAEIAQAWNETPKAVESLLTRARVAFREAYRSLE